MPPRKPPGKPRCRWKACQLPEIDGLEYCVFHVPDELLEEAEEIAGVSRCRHKFGEPEACRRQAVTGANVCDQHGANAGSVTRTVAGQRVIEGKMSDRLGEIMTEHSERLLKPAPIEDPFEELMSTLAEVKALKDLMRDIVHELIARQSIRWASTQAGEQLRVEILVYERAVERLMAGLTNVIKLNIEDRMAGIREAQLRMLEHALEQALEASGVGIDGKLSARQRFRANVQVIKGELSA